MPAASRSSRNRSPNRFLREIFTHENIYHRILNDHALIVTFWMSTRTFPVDPRRKFAVYWEIQLKILIGIAMLAITTCATAATTKKSSDTPATGQIAFINAAKDAIQKCNAEYQHYKLMEHMADVGWEAEYNSNQAMADATGTPAAATKRNDPPAYHVACRDQRKAEVIPQSKSFMKSFKSSESKSRARDMVAQWITAIDAIGNEGSQSEEARFQTLANGLLIDSQ